MSKHIDLLIVLCLPSLSLSCNPLPFLCYRTSSLGSGSLCDCATCGYAVILEMENLQAADLHPQRKAWVFKAVSWLISKYMPTGNSNIPKCWVRECSLPPSVGGPDKVSRQTVDGACWRTWEKDRSSCEFMEEDTTSQVGMGNQGFLLSSQTLILNDTWSVLWVFVGSADEVELWAWEEEWFLLILIFCSFD